MRSPIQGLGGLFCGVGGIIWGLRRLMRWFKIGGPRRSRWPGIQAERLSLRSARLDLGSKGLDMGLVGLILIMILLLIEKLRRNGFEIIDQSNRISDQKHLTDYDTIWWQRIESFDLMFYTVSQNAVHIKLTESGIIQLDMKSTCNSFF